jgi:hypothetical protein
MGGTHMTGSDWTFVQSAGSSIKPFDSDRNKLL